MANNEKENKETLKDMDKKINILTILVAFLMVISIISMIFFIVNKDDTNDKKENQIEEEKDDNKDDNNSNEEKDEDNKEEDEKIKIEQLDINTKEISDLYGLIRMDDFSDYNYIKSESYFFSNITSFIYRREKTIPSEFNEWGGFSYYLVNYLDANNYIKKEDVFGFSGVDNYGAIIKKNDLKEVLYKFFGNNYLIENLTDKNMGFEYIESSDSYRIYLQGGDTAFQSTVSKLIKAEKDENNIYLYEKIAVVAPGEDLYYTNYLDNKKIGKPLNGKDIWEYEEDLSTFMYTFEKDSNGEYHLKSMEYYEIK